MMPEEIPTIDRTKLVDLFKFVQELEKEGWKIPHPYSDIDKNLLILEAKSTGVHLGFVMTRVAIGLSMNLILGPHSRSWSFIGRNDAESNSSSR